MDFDDAVRRRENAQESLTGWEAKLSGLVFATAGPLGEIAHLFVSIAGQAKQAHSSKEDNGPADSKNDPPQHCA